MDKPIAECEECLFVGDNSNRCMTCIQIERARENDISFNLPDLDFVERKLLERGTA